MGKNDDTDLLTRQRDTLATSLADLENRFESALKLLSVLYRLTEIPLTALGVTQAAQRTVDALVREMGHIEACSILIYDPAAGALKLEAAKGRADLLEDHVKDYNQALTFSPGEGVAGRAFTDRRPYFVAPHRPEAELLRRDPDREPPASLASLPLISQDRPLGVLNISFSPIVPFDPPRQRDLTLVGSVTANVLQACGAPVGLDFFEAGAGEAADPNRPRAMSRLTPGLTHDFNNLLASIQGYAELLMTDETDETRRDWLGRILIAGQSCSRIVNRLGAMWGQPAVGPEGAFDLAEVVSDAVAVTRPRWKDQAQAEGETIDLQINLAETGPVWGSAAQVRELVATMLLNALEEVSPNGTITIDLAPGREQTAVFRLGRRPLDLTTDRERPPELALPEHIISRHGAVLIEETDGQGLTTQIITFPSPPEEVSTDETPPEADRGRLKVLVVDDEPAVQELLVKMIDRMGYQTVSATDPGQALALVEQSRPDIILTDFSMPGMTGLDLARLIKKQHPDLPIILTTGWSQNLGAEVDLSVIDLTLAKPFKFEDVAQAVDRARHRPDRE